MKVFILLLLLLSIVYCIRNIRKKYKLFYFWNHEQITLKNNFESSLLNHSYLELIPIELKTKISTSNFGTKDFKKIITEKIHIIVKQIIPRNMGKKVVISDIDIQVFKSFEFIFCDYKMYDIVFQKEGTNLGYNTGFMLIKCTEKILNLFQVILDTLNNSPTNKFINEQKIMNDVINNYDINHTHFPDTIWAFSNKPMPNKKDIILHHANVTLPSKNYTSLQKKLKQLADIKNLIEN